jgi:hypothetical protein
MAKKVIGYRRTYKIKASVPGRRYVSVGMPYEIVERESALRNMSVPEFIDNFVAVAEYDNFDGVHYTFKERGNGEK